MPRKIPSFMRTSLRWYLNRCPNNSLGYELKESMHLPKGTRIDCVAHFDNSVNNKYNPNPNKEVKWGDQTFEEMMIGFFGYVVPAQQPAAASAGAGTR